MSPNWRHSWDRVLKTSVHLLLTEPTFCSSLSTFQVPSRQRCAHCVAAIITSTFLIHWSSLHSLQSSCSTGTALKWNLTPVNNRCWVDVSHQTLGICCLTAATQWKWQSAGYGDILRNEEVQANTRSECWLRWQTFVYLGRWMKIRRSTIYIQLSRTEKSQGASLTPARMFCIAQLLVSSRNIWYGYRCINIGTGQKYRVSVISVNPRISLSLLGRRWPVMSLKLNSNWLQLPDGTYCWPRHCQLACDWQQQQYCCI